MLENSITHKIEPKYFPVIGRMLAKKEPEKAAEYLRLIYACDNQGNDFTRMHHLFILFCNSHGIPAPELKNSRNSTIRVTLYRVFICSMLHLYFPDIFEIPLKDVRLRSSQRNRQDTLTFLDTLHNVLNLHKSGLSKMIRESIAWDKKYTDFQNQVTTALVHYKNYHR